MKVFRGDLLNLWYALEGLKNKKRNVNFSYFIAKNKIAIKGEVDAINEAQQASEAFKAFDSQRASLAKELADKVPGTVNPVTKGNNYVIEENKEKFDEEMKKLRAKFEDAISDREKQIESFNNLLSEKVEFEGHVVKLENLPDQIEPAVIEVLIKTGLIDE